MFEITEQQDIYYLWSSLVKLLERTKEASLTMPHSDTEGWEYQLVCINLIPCIWFADEPHEEIPILESGREYEF